MALSRKTLQVRPFSQEGTLHKVIAGLMAGSAMQNCPPDSSNRAMDEVSGVKPSQHCLPSPTGCYENSWDLMKGALATGQAPVPLCDGNGNFNVQLHRLGLLAPAWMLECI